jgi:hypothetical protein
MRTSETVTKITEALLKAQAEIKHAIKDAQNPHLKNTYATLESVIDAIKEPLIKNNIVVLQFPDNKTLTTRLQHNSGEFIENTLELILTKNDMQGLMSAITYARRVSLVSLLNIAQADDDGNLASKTKAPPKVIQKAPMVVSKKDPHDF